MYHDQGHIPLKLAGFKLEPQTNTFTQMSGINCTLGLPIIRTSVDHGTAFDRAGKNCSNEQSMVEAIEAAAAMARNWTCLEEK
jgi:4-hydroxythreonine-4-phosphate dehydrogenase